MSAGQTPATLRSVLSISAVDGWSLLLFGGAGTVASLAMVSWIGCVIGALVASAGLLELRGRARIKLGDSKGFNAMITAQLIVLVTLCTYAASKLLNYDEAAVTTAIMPRLEEALARQGVSPADFDLHAMIRAVYFATYFAVIVATVLFQGGLALLYNSRRKRFEAAATTNEATPPPLPGEQR